MTMRILPMMAVASFLFGPAALAKIELARDGKSAYVIVVADNAIPAEKTAAAELQEHLKLVTGAELPVMTEGALAGGAAPRILVGRTQAAKRHVPSLRWDGIVMKAKGDTLILVGGGPRGTLYAVSTFLEEIVGVRWWTSTERTIPTTPTLAIPDNLDVAHVPRFVYREVYNHDAIGGGEHARFAMRMKLNGQSNDLPPELGGHYTLIGWCHTSFNLIPPDTYFANHPEWFAQLNGQRQTGGQLCLSNAAMRKELIRNALRRVRRNPDAGIISISQEDRHGACECAACREIVDEEGSQAGPWIRLCNQAAEAINAEFPAFLVETLAYQYTRTPPRKTRPGKNVLVRLCSIECDFSHPLAGESNQRFGDDLRGWAAIAPNLFIWNYVTNSSNYLIPHPNMTPLGEDLRFFAQNNVVGLFEQGDAFNAAGDFLSLRTWMLARLLWDPSRDQSALRDEFLAGYYGAAAPHLAKYLDLVNAKSADAAFRAGCYIGKPDYLSDEDIRAANELFAAAAEAVKGDADRARRVARERLVIEHVNLLRHDFASAAKDPEAALAAYERRVRAWADASRAAGVTHFSEGRGFDSYVPTLLARGRRFVPPTLPAPGANMAPGAFDIQQDRFGLHNAPASAQLVGDPKASDGRAARMPGGLTDWAVQFPVPAAAAFAGPGPWECFIVVRVDPKAKSGAAFSFGLHDRGGRGYVARDHVGLDVAGDGAGAYRAYAITVDELTPDMYFWVAPPGNAAQVDAVYVDRIFIRKREAAQ